MSTAFHEIAPTAPILDDPWLTPEQVAEQALVAICTVYRAIKGQKLKAVKINGGRVYRIRQSWAGAWLEAGSLVNDRQIA